MFSVEDAPFKLTKEMVDVMGGVGSSGYTRFRGCLVEGFVALQKYHSEISALLQTTGQHSPFPCFNGAKLGRIVADLRTRLCVGCSRQEIRHRVDYLLRKSYNAWGTRQFLFSCAVPDLLMCNLLVLPMEPRKLHARVIPYCCAL
uniref:PI3K/PI4K catalytic domain-containing protein n=1 Tax=Hyaloperonospora arabidopsidis (strain Emoy2) TaxID=559515 RepID=M4B7A4_HYAAE